MSVKNIMHVKRLYLEPPTCSCDNRKYLASIIDDLAIICDEIMETYDEETKTILSNFKERKEACKTKNCYILLVFLLVTIELLIAVNIYCYLIKYQKNKQTFITISCHK